MKQLISEDDSKLNSQTYIANTDSYGNQQQVDSMSKGKLGWDLLLDDEMMNNIQNIVKDIDEKINNDSLTSLRKDTLGEAHSREYQTTKQTKSKKIKQKPSLVERLSNRLDKYKRIMKNSSLEGYDTKPSVGTGNNPLYNYPKIPPPLIYDPKYGKEKKRNHTEFATTAKASGKTINPLETVGKYNSTLPFRPLIPVQKTKYRKT